MKIPTLAVLLVASLAVHAQTSPPAPSGRGDVQAATGISSENSGNARATAQQQQRNVAVSKATPKLSKQEKSQLAKDATRLNVNPENSAGQAATARMQRQTTPASKQSGRQNAELRTTKGRQQLDADLRSKSSP
jgi:hypothetical protein